jgi:hypothetical protein
MKILIVYFQLVKSDRNTIDEHLYAFRRYSRDEIYYLNVFFGVPKFIQKIHFDLVIYHYTFTSLKWEGENRFTSYLRKYSTLKQVSGYKVAIPQDEYVNSIPMCRFFNEFGVKTVFTCIPPSEYEKVYPRELSGLDHYFTVFTGYVDEQSLDEVSVFRKPHSERMIDVGYRARKLPYWLGSHSLIKWKLTERFRSLPGYGDMNIDLSNDYADVFVGKAWYQFLGNCRVVLGCEGGASLHDPRGEIRKRVDAYVADHPDAAYEEVEECCFKGLDGNLNLFALSPRHFEACITKTCQALVEGEYAGIFKPGIHYIEIKKDWSNLQEVMDQIRDVSHCERIAEKAYQDIILSGQYTYKKFVDLVLEHGREMDASGEYSAGLQEKFRLYLLEARDAHPFVFSPFYFIFNALYHSSRKGLYAFLRGHDLEQEYTRLSQEHGLSAKMLFEFAKVILRHTIQIAQHSN